MLPAERISCKVREKHAISVWDEKLKSAQLGERMERMEGEEESGWRWGRTDFVIQDQIFNPETNEFSFSMAPDPRRYIRVKEGPDKGYLDKYLRVLIPEDLMMKQLAEQMKNLSVYSLTPTIKSASGYAASRNNAIRSELNTGTYIKPDEQAAPHSPLVIGKNTKWLAFLSIDICNGSILRIANRTAFDTAYKIFLRELATVVGQFNGTVLKTTGDGFIAYIDHPAFTQQGDNTIDLGLTFLVVLRDSINPALKESGLPELKIRVGADYGTVQLRTHEVPSTGFSSSEVGSDALNLAVKIEQSCEENEFRIGRALYEIIHVQWLERATEINCESGNFGIPNYRIYRMR